MPDQKRNFANIGDVPKHVALPILAAGFDEQVKQVDQKWIYCESHAGYYDYPRNDTKWTVQQECSIGVLEKKGKLTEYYGKHFCKEIGDIKLGRYPGSIKIIETTLAEKFNSLVGIRGWDTNEDVVDSYRDKNQLINVKPGDGFDGVSSLRELDKKLVFCDPFWREPQRPKDPKPDDVKGWLQTLDKGEPNELANYLNRLETFLRAKQDLEKTMDSVRALLGEQDHVILWYKRFPGQKLFFKNEEFKYCFKIDWEFKHYVGKKLPWIKNLKGAGLIIKGIEEEFCVKAYEKIRELETVFNGETWNNNPEPEEIKLDLKVEFSRRGGNDDWFKHPRP